VSTILKTIGSAKVHFGTVTELHFGTVTELHFR
jgi:hypothetical protein